MKFLRGYATGFGALLLVLAFILTTVVPERSAFIWCVSAFGLALFATGLFIHRARVVAVMKGKKARAAGASAGYALTVLAVLVLVNFLAERHHKRFDLTESKEFSLSEQTVKVLESLPREVSVTSFFPEGEPAKQKFDDLTAEYS